MFRHKYTFFLLSTSGKLAQTSLSCSVPRTSLLLPPSHLQLLDLLHQIQDVLISRPLEIGFHPSCHFSFIIIDLTWLPVISHSLSGDSLLPHLLGRGIPEKSKHQLKCRVLHTKASLHCMQSNVQMTIHFSLMRVQADPFGMCVGGELTQLNGFSLAAEALHPARGDTSNSTARKGGLITCHQEICLTQTTTPWHCPRRYVPVGSYCYASSKNMPLFCNNKCR